MLIVHYFSKEKLQEKKGWMNLFEPETTLHLQLKNRIMEQESVSLLTYVQSYYPKWILNLS